MDEQIIKEVIINPYYAITIAPMLATDHDPMISKEQWVQANMRLIEELGAEAWLKQLLEVLANGGPTSDDVEVAE